MHIEGVEPTPRKGTASKTVAAANFAIRAYIVVVNFDVSGATLPYRVNHYCSLANHKVCAKGFEPPPYSFNGLVLQTSAANRICLTHYVFTFRPH